MKEYIDKDSLVGAFLDKKFSTTESSIKYGEAINLIQNQPAADVQEVRRGNWIINSDGYYPYCSECGSEPKSGELTLYCSYCGAIMDKEIS